MSDSFCNKLRKLLSHGRMVERITIWHPGNGQTDQVCIRLEDAQDFVDPISGYGVTLEEALNDLENNVVTQGGV